MPKYAERIKEVRDYLGQNQQDFSSLIDVGLSTLTGWEEDRHTPRPPTVRKITELINKRAAELGLDPINYHWLRTGEGEKFRPPHNHTLTSRATGDVEGKLVKEMVAEPPNKHEKIKHLRSQVADTIKKTNSHPGVRIWAYAGAGNPFNADPDESEPMEVLHIESLVSPRYRDAFRITGISMAPVIRDKALVFCDFNDKILKTGGIYALNIPGEGLVVKEIRSEKEEGSPMRWVVYSYNEALYKPLYYALNELQEIGAIIGRIVLIHQELPKEGVHINLG